MQKLQLYIEGQRVDLFDDESVSITQTIQNVKDIAKVFTTFTKTFNVPASKVNNKIFSHYYNFDIVDGFDARIKKTATIELNTIPFKRGKIKLEGVNLKYNKPHTYKLTFFGDSIELKELIGEDKLSVLSSLDNNNQTFDPDGLRSGLVSDPATRDVITPLMTHTQRLYYNSGENEPDKGNLFRHGTSSGHKHGLKWTDLKFAIRVHRIIEAIEDKYNITFSDDFFNTNNPDYYMLFMWMHRNKGQVIRGEQLLTFTKIIDGWPGGTFNTFYMSNDRLFWNYLPAKTNAFKLLLVRGFTSTFPYDVTIYRDGVPYITQTGITTAGTHQINIPTNELYFGAEFKVEISFTSSAPLVFTNVVWQSDYEDQFNNFVSEQAPSGQYQVDAEFEFIISGQLPDMKILDFLTGLFKMFNLTTFVEEDGTVYVDHLENFYANKTSSGSPYDISEYVDIKESQVNTALPYRQIEFKYEDTKTFLAANHDQLFNSEWGSLKYTETDDFGNRVSGSLYKIVAPFGHPKYERLYDLDDQSLTTIQWGWSVDQNQQPYIGKPILFYPIRQRVEDNGTNVAISYITDFNDDGTFKTVESIWGQICMPSSSVSFDPNVSVNNIHFNNELNEFTGSQEFTGTLFENHYSDYISDVFNPKSRLTKVTAYLPLEILYKLTLADRIIVNGNIYKINSLTTNLQTGKSNFELLNEHN